MSAETYDVALSFAGEQRAYVEEVANVLQSRGINVFYDGFELVDLWGRSLGPHLQDVFEHQSRYVVMFISKEYVDKSWPSHERRAAISRFSKDRGQYILPIRFDDTIVGGIPDDLSYLSARDLSPSELATMIAEKIGATIQHSAKDSHVPPPQIPDLIGEAIFDYSNHDGRFSIGRDNLLFETQWSNAGDGAIHVYNDPRSIKGIAIATGCRRIADIRNAKGFDFTSRARTPYAGDIVVFRNVHDFYAAAQILSVKTARRGAGRYELSFRYMIQDNGTDSFYPNIKTSDHTPRIRAGGSSMIPPLYQLDDDEHHAFLRSENDIKTAMLEIVNRLRGIDNTVRGSVFMHAIEDLQEYPVEWVLRCMEALVSVGFISLNGLTFRTGADGYTTVFGSLEDFIITLENRGEQAINR